MEQQGEEGTYQEPYTQDASTFVEEPQQQPAEVETPQQQQRESHDAGEDDYPDRMDSPSEIKESPTLPTHTSDKENEKKMSSMEGLEEEDVISKDPIILAQLELIKSSTPETDLEIALSLTLKRKEHHVARLTGEILKLKKFISKRKQTYKRKRKDDGAPTRALSGYNIFIKERFAQLSKENEQALKSDDKDATMKRVPPANLVAATGNAWKALSAEEKKKYDDIAKSDRKRYDEQMAAYQPPDKHANRKRNKTGYNMFFSAHVLRLKQTESGVPSERGSVARLVGTAWKQLSAEEKAYYEREADKHNGSSPLKEGEEEYEEEEAKRQQLEYQMHADMHMQMGAPVMHVPPQHDPRQHHGYYPPHMYGPPPPYGYDYSQHHQRHQQARAQGYQQGPYPPTQRYE